MYYAFKAGKEKDMIVSCPICHNEIEFKTKGKSDNDVMKLFEVNNKILNNIYNNEDLLHYVQNEEETLKHGL